MGKAIAAVVGFVTLIGVPTILYALSGLAKSKAVRGVATKALAQGAGQMAKGAVKRRQTPPTHPIYTCSCGGQTYLNDGRSGCCCCGLPRLPSQTYRPQENA